MGTFGIGGSKSKSKSSQTNTLAPWSQQQFDSQKSGILDTVDKYNANNPYKAYTGPMVANMTAPEQQARQIASANVGSTAGILGDAESAIRTGMSYDAADPSRYFNPFEDQVVQNALGDIERSRGMQRVNDAQGATSAGAWGGSRHGVADSLTNEGALRTAASTAANLRQSGYDKAVQTGFQQQQGQYQGAGLLGQTAEQKQAAWMRDAEVMSQLGATEREIEQAKLLASRAEFDREAADQYQRMMLELQTRQGLLGATPMLVNSTGTGTQTGTSVSFSGNIGGK